jgi:hypothetical protein
MRRSLIWITLFAIGLVTIYAWQIHLIPHLGEIQARRLLLEALRKYPNKCAQPGKSPVLEFEDRDWYLTNISFRYIVNHCDAITVELHPNHRFWAFPVVFTPSGWHATEIYPLPPDLTGVRVHAQPQDSGSLTSEELRAIRTRVPDMRHTVSGEFSVQSYLGVIAESARFEFELVGEGASNEKMIRLTDWSTTTHGIMVWLHDACGVRYALGASGKLQIRLPDPSYQGTRCDIEPVAPIAK